MIAVPDSRRLSARVDVAEETRDDENVSDRFLRGNGAALRLYLLEVGGAPEVIDAIAVATCHRCRDGAGHDITA